MTKLRSQRLDQCVRVRLSRPCMEAIENEAWRDRKYVSQLIRECCTDHLLERGIDVRPKSIWDLPPSEWVS